MVTSVTLKKLLTITGDGHSTIDELVRSNDRCFLQYQKLVQQNKIDLTHVPEPG